jgi:hypothetical protein
VYFLAAHALGTDAFFDVRSRVTAAPTWSFVTKDPREKRYGVGFVLHPALWKRDRLYVSRVEVRERPGRERFYGLWRGNQVPRLPTGDGTIEFFERP